MKSVYDNTILQLEEVRRQNKTLSQKTKDIMNQISEEANEELAEAINLKESLTASKRKNEQEYNQMNLSLLRFQ